ncbi:MAG: hypothetical protein QOH97_1888 [Actinoplanes sp.]|jgi:sugar/nucleoside kinase (ribokinase family)|nr:hypothetical protein [Actinoplanes sp.]
MWLAGCAVTPDRTLDLVCVSYLADTQLLRVGAYPPANGGAVIDHIGASIGADGPLTAVTAARLGLRTGLVANSVGPDPVGHKLLEALDSIGVEHAITTLQDTITPQLTVIIDDSGTRTWLAALAHAPEQLEAANLHLLGHTRLIYIDCYRVLTRAAVRAIQAAGDTPLLLNLGGDTVDEAIVAATHGQRIAAVQTSIDEPDSATAATVANTLYAQLRPDAALVTIGRLGAVARTKAGIVREAAPPVVVAHTHGAGAAFSAGYAHALLTGQPIDAALRAACSAGSAYCAGPTATVPHHLPAALATS